MPKVRMPDGSFVDVGTDALFNDDGQSPFVPATTPPLQPGERFFTEADLQKAREDEKGKLYGEISRTTEELTSLREQVGTLTSAQQAEQQRLEQEKARLEAEARQREEQELDAKSLIERRSEEWNQTLAQREQEWQQRFEQAEQARQAAEAVAAKEREFGELRDYTLAQVEANKDKVHPSLLNWVSGNSKAEIDAAIARAVETTDQMAAEFQELIGGQQVNPLNLQPGQQQVVVAQPPVTPGTRATGGPGNSDPAGQQQTLTAEQINNMDMASYAQLRGKLGIGGQSNNRGLFG